MDEAGFYSESYFWAHCSRRKQVSRLRKIRPLADDLAALEMTMMGGGELAGVRGSSHGGTQLSVVP